MFFSGCKQGGRRWRGTRPFLGSCDLSSEDTDKGRREECTDGSLFCLAQHSCTAEVKGNCFKILFANSALCFPAIPGPWDANCKPEGLVLNAHLFWRVSPRGPGSCWVARHCFCKGMRAKEYSWEKCTAAFGEEARTKGCTRRGWCGPMSGLETFTKAMKCSVKLAYTLPAMMSYVQYSFLVVFHSFLVFFFVANNSLV